VKLLLLRHTDAMPRGAPGVADDDRPLTPSGKATFRVAARGLTQIVRRPDVLLTSPLARARATAEIAARAFKRITPTLEPALADESVKARRILPDGSSVRIEADGEASLRSQERLYEAMGREGTLQA
jgi:phosphohistidine phosphatase SixA